MKISDVKNIAVIGAGNMGHQISVLCALKGFKTSCTDTNTDVLKKAEEFAAGYLKKLLDSGESEKVQARAVPLQQAFRNLAYGWMHLWSLTKAIPALNNITGSASEKDIKKISEENSEAAFYYGRILSSRFFLGSEFIKYSGILDSILSEESAATDCFEHIFTGAPEE